MKRNRTVCWVDPDTLRVLDLIPVTGEPERYIRFDSKFEARVFVQLYDLTEDTDLWVERQYPIELSSVSGRIHPVRGMKTKVDFAIMKRIDGADVPVLFVEAKGVVDREFRLMLGLMSTVNLHRYLIVCQSPTGVKALRAIATDDHMKSQFFGFSSLRSELRPRLSRFI